VHALLVPIRDESGDPCDGVRIEDCGAKLGLNGVDNGRLWFDNVRIPRENLLDKLAQVHEDGTYFSPIENPTRRFFTMLGTLIQGRISVGGASISASKVALTIAVRRALERRQFGAPGAEQEALLMDYRTHQRRLLIPLAKTYALAFTQNRLVQDLHAVFTDEDTPERERRELETLAAGVKAIATWHATDTIQGCREACGGAGYLRSSRFASLKADTDVFTTFEGDNTILLQLTAKNLLTDYKDAFGDLDKLGMAQFVAGQALSVLGERVPLRKLAESLRPGRDDDADLLDPKTQLELFRWRHEHLLAGAARRLKGGIDAKRDPFDVLVDTQDHVLEVARSWVDLVILESFVEGAKGNALLGKLCSLYALSVIETERGYFQEHGRLSGARSKAVVKAVNALCGELRPDVRELVDAFGVPETALGDARVVAEEQERVPA
jgi:acyl-CoA oxidase